VSDDELYSLLAERFEEEGISEHAAARMAAFVVALCDVRIESRLARLLPLRGCRFGWALLRELRVETETTEAAARRLCCNPRVLHRYREEIRALLGGQCHTP
jgi:hypothetical protein